MNNFLVWTPAYFWRVLYQNELRELPLRSMYERIVLISSLVYLKHLYFKALKIILLRYFKKFLRRFVSSESVTQVFLYRSKMQ